MIVNSLDDIVRLHLVETLRHFNGCRTSTSRALGISRQTVIRMLRKYNIESEFPRARGRVKLESSL